MTFGLESIEFGVSFLLPIIPKSNWGNVSGETRNCVRLNHGTDGLYCSVCLKMNGHVIDRLKNIYGLFFSIR